MMQFSKEQKVIGGILGVVAIVAVVLWFSNSSDDPASLQTQAPVAPQQQITEVRTFNVGGVQNETLGVILADNAGKTLYTFANDGQNVSNCTGDCATNWPPYVFADPSQFVVPPTIESLFSTFERADGKGFQVAYQGKPLYYYAGDPTPGDANGNGFNGVWSVIQIQQTDEAPATTAPQQ